MISFRGLENENDRDGGVMTGRKAEAGREKTCTLGEFRLVNERMLAALQASQPLLETTALDNDII